MHVVTFLHCPVIIMSSELSFFSQGDYDVVINDYEKAKSLFGNTEVPVFKKGKLISPNFLTQLTCALSLYFISEASLVVVNTLNCLSVNNYIFLCPCSVQCMLRWRQGSEL